MTARHAPQLGSLRAFCSPRCCAVCGKSSSNLRRFSHRAMTRVRAAGDRSNGKPVLLFDAMDTLVWDPFYTEMPLFFDMKFQDLLSAKDPHAWPEFERGEIDETQLYERFFKDRRPVNGPALLNHMVNGYRWLDGIEFLLLDLNRQDVEMHVITNYPVWYKRIEAKLGVSRFLPWTFVSSEGPMKGLRKPDPQSYKVVSDTLGVPPEQLLLIDDRQANIIGALESGWGALQFNNAPALRRDLERRSILDGKRRINPG